MRRLPRAGTTSRLKGALVMTRRQRVSTLAAAAAATALWVTTAGVDGQGGPKTKPQSALKIASAAPSVPVQNPMERDTTPVPINADGHADLNGMWEYRTSTPLQRAPQHGMTL